MIKTVLAATIAASFLALTPALAAVDTHKHAVSPVHHPKHWHPVKHHPWHPKPHHPKPHPRPHHPKPHHPKPAPKKG